MITAMRPSSGWRPVPAYVPELPTIDEEGETAALPAQRAAKGPPGPAPTKPLPPPPALRRRDTPIAGHQRLAPAEHEWLHEQILRIRNEREAKAAAMQP